MPTLFELFNILAPDALLEIFDSRQYLVHEGTVESLKLSEEDLLNITVEYLSPGIVTKIFLENYNA